LIIRSMTASFGRLEKESLHLREGLNIIQAPNEGGKSTWCAFLRCMLYGVDTSQRERAGQKPDKIRYSPWSGAPMAGTVELEHHGERITLRRNTRLPNAPMREFSAVYTDTGQPVPALSGALAGRQLTGVEEAVFRRTAFIGQGAIAVRPDAELERKITGLVTTGEEDASFTEAADCLRAWQRQRRWRSKGRLPEVEAELQQIARSLTAMESQQRELTDMEEQISRLEQQEQRLASQLRLDEYSRREEALVRLEKAQTRQQKLEEMAQLRRREAEERCKRLKESPFAGREPAQVEACIESDLASVENKKTHPRWRWIFPVLLVALGAAGCLGSVFREAWLLYAGIGLLSLGVLLGILCGYQDRKRKRVVSSVYAAWGVSSPEELRTLGSDYAAAWEAAGAAVRLAGQVQQEADRAARERRDIQSEVVAQLGTEGQTAQHLRQTHQQLQQLRELQAAGKARLDLQGDPLVLSSQQQQLQQEQSRLEEEYRALELALQELEAANQTLQTEFSPRLVRRTAYWMGRLTGGRYEEVSLDREFNAAVRSREDILPRESGYLSQGTANQLYLALRLALCELILPEEDPCPLVLDDALMAFDEERLGYALEALLEFAQRRQILLFTCQDREKRYLEKRGGTEP